MRRFFPYLLACVPLGFVLLRAVLALPASDLFTDADDVMRLVGVHDLLAGRDFADPMQYRDNTPFGSPMHWSALIDLPLAALVRSAAPLGPVAADTLALIVWPSLLFLVMIGMSVLLARRLAGPAAMVPAMVLPLLSVPVLTEFAPGRIDHHNVQMLLSMGLVLALVDARTSGRAALLAGIACGFSLAIGMEALAFVILAILVIGLFLAFTPKVSTGPARLFALGLAGSTLSLFAVTTAPARYVIAACDALSITYLVAACAAALALLAASLLAARLQLWQARLLLLAVLGGLAAGLTLWLFPQCAGGPYAELDPFLSTVIMPAIPEAQSLAQRWLATPAFVASCVLVPLVGLATTLVLMLRTRGDVRVAWSILFAFAVVASLIMVLQIRGARLAAPLAMPACAWLIAAAWQRFRAGNSLSTALKVVLACLASASLVQLSLALPAQAALHRRPPPAAAAMSPDCLARSSFAELATIPSARLVLDSGLGPRTLLFTPHSITASGFHRNADGLADTWRFFGRDAEAAHAVARRRGLDYAVVCRQDPDASAFLAAIAADPAWNWLAPVSDPNAMLQILRID